MFAIKRNVGKHKFTKFLHKIWIIESENFNAFTPYLFTFLTSYFSFFSHPLFYRTFAFVAIKINLLCNNHGFITRTASPCSTFRHITFFYDFLCAQRLLLDVQCVCLLYSILFFSLAAQECR